MSVIATHDVTLSCGRIVLRPLTDEHLPLLYKWCADPEVLYWTEGGEEGEVLSYSPEVVREIYGGVSKSAHCFLVEADGAPIGDCWLQRMNFPHIRDMYAPGTDVRRIDMSIGEKEYWSKGIGTEMVRLLVEFAFEKEQVSVLHCLCEDYNIRSRRVWEKNGFSLIQMDALAQPQKGKYQYHYRLTKQEYENRKHI